MKLPESWTRVTLLSKILAILLFVLLPFIGFYFGQKAQVCDFCPNAIPTFQNKNIITTVTPTPIISIVPGKVIINDNKDGHWGTYENSKGLKFKFPPNYDIGYSGTNINNQDYFSISRQPEEEMMPGESYDFYISYDSNLKNLMEYVASEVSLLKYQHTNNPGFRIFNENTIKYGNKTAFQFTVEASQSPLIDHIYFFNNGVGLHISESGIPNLENSKVMNSIVFSN